MKRFFLALILVAVLSLLPVSGVFAVGGTVEVTASGEYVAFTSTPTTLALGTVIADQSYWSKGTAPAWSGALLDTECYWTVNNASTVATDTTIDSDSWTGTTPWANGDGTNSEDAYAMWAGAVGTADEATFLTQVVVAAGTLVLKANQDALTSYEWEFKFEAPDVMTGGDEKTGTITLTMVTYVP